MNIDSLLIANRGEIAIRVMRSAAEMGLRTVAVHSDDDADALHVQAADEVRRLSGVGPAAYLDGAQLVALAKEAGCQAVHPGYGFLSENAAFAQLCADAGLKFVGPNPGVLKQLGDKVRARQLAEQAGVPVLPGSIEVGSAEEAKALFARLGSDAALVIKAVHGGGGRGMRVVQQAGEVDDAFVRCRSEAQAAFGNGALFVEQFVAQAVHIEVQIVGDQHGHIIDLGERDCSIQRRHQKVVEMAPSPQLSAGLRARILEAARRLAGAVGYDNVGTFEFLVDAAVLPTDSPSAELPSETPFWFIEANPRLQVEHTVTEEITGVDLVRVQLDIASGATLAQMRLEQPPAARGMAMQLRVNAETPLADGSVKPSAGTLIVFEVPSGPGVRVDTHGYAGYRLNSRYDSLLAKVIVHAPRGDFAALLARARRSLQEFQIDGVATNAGYLLALLAHPQFAGKRLRTCLLDQHAAELTANIALKRVRAGTASRATSAAGARAGAKLQSSDPLAVLSYGREAREASAQAGTVELADAPSVSGPEGTVPIVADMQSTIVSIAVEEGQLVRQGQEVLVLNAMKMEHVVSATVSGLVRMLLVDVGDTVFEGAPLLYLEVQATEQGDAIEAAPLDPDTLRPDLASVERKRALTTDNARAEAVTRRHKRGQRTARENIEDLCDPGTFMQYGSLSVGMGLTGTVDELLGYAPSDGMVMGIGHVNGASFDESRSRCIAMSYDYTVLAGTQGGMNHKMKDRMLQVAERMKLPVVLFTEGGGGRAGGGSRAARGGGEGMITGGGGLGTPSWNLLGRLSGLAPTIGINSGLSFAGNAALLGCCDVIIATANSSIGMGGPAMIEGGGLGVYRPEEVGPMSVQVPNGVVDVAVADEAEGVRVAKQYLSYFQGRMKNPRFADQRLLRHAIPENRLRVYDIRALIQTLADTDSVLELRRDFGKAMVTSLVRLDGRPVGIIANNPQHLSGAIDSDAADKAARFMQLCDAYDLPLVFLCDTPGIMVGPEAEKTALVRHAARMFVVSAGVTVPTFAVVLRKSYGLGAQTMGGGNHRLPNMIVAWPTAEFGGMGLEGQVKLGQRARLEAIEDPQERQRTYERMVAAAYERGSALNAAHVFEIDDVIDPANTRRWLVGGLMASPLPLPRDGKKRSCIDTW